MGIVKLVFKTARDQFPNKLMDFHQHRGHLLGKRKKTRHANMDTGAQDSPSPSPNPQKLTDDLRETDSDSEQRMTLVEPGGDWDPHAGTKPSLLDGEASDELWDPGDDFEEAESEAFNMRMVQMLSDVQMTTQRSGMHLGSYYWMVH